ncbi:hypothetical protein [Endozoicomonas ascidiicola]|uniref:hypothetical protein n=1 Tax=Endozoicomonas ascidiicola TaxID=1698521 RepID=UPI000831BEDA|nr:hypothetical protein [Endozoicomonas ascidiicola]USN27009.1 hypothetical protein [synthetic construct]
MSDSKIYVFSDLDDTLISTKGKLPEGVSYETGAYDRDGAPLSFFSNHQKTLVSLLERANAIIIPITGRTSGALGRVNYSFQSYSAVSHGAVVLTPDGVVCDHWQKSVYDQPEDWFMILEKMNEQVQKYIDVNNLDARTRVIVDQNIAAYVSVKGSSAALEALEPMARDSLLGLHRNGRNLACLPPYACKKQAVEHIKQFLSIDTDDLVLGMGDSITDLPFIRSCHFGVIPVDSQIDRELVCE